MHDNNEMAIFIIGYMHMHVQYCEFPVPGIGLIWRLNSQWEFPKFPAPEFPRWEFHFTM